MKPVIIITIIVLISVVSITSISAQTQSEIPSWIKSTASFWVDGQIEDSEFLGALQFLVKEGILVIPDEDDSQNEILSDGFVSDEIKGLFPFRHELGTEWVIELNTSEDWENIIPNTLGNQVYYHNPTVVGFSTPEAWVTIWKFENVNEPAKELEYVYENKVIQKGGYTVLDVPKSPFEFDKECYSVKTFDGTTSMVVIECILQDRPFYVSVVVIGDPWDFKTEQDLDWFPTANKFMNASLDKIRMLS